MYGAKSVGPEKERREEGGGRREEGGGRREEGEQYLCIFYLQQ